MGSMGRGAKTLTATAAATKSRLNHAPSLDIMTLPGIFKSRETMKTKWVWLGILLCGCIESNPQPSPMGGDWGWTVDTVESAEASGAPDVTEVTVAVDSAADTGADTTVAPPIRAFVVTDAADLLQGREATGRIGDLRIENEHIVAIVGALDHHMWGPFGGGILDLAVAGGDDRFQEAFSTAGFLRAVRPETVEVAADGTDGDAVIRVRGTDGAIPLVDLIIQTEPVGLDVTVEYRLAADSPCLEVHTIATNPTDGNVTAALGDGLFWSETGRVFGPGAGYNEEALLALGGMDYIGADQPGLTHLVTPLGGAEVSVALLKDELSLLSYEMVALGPGESAEVRRCIYAAPGRSLLPLAHHWETRGQETVAVSGSVQVPTAGYELARARVEIYRNDAFVGATAPGTDGAFAFKAPPGEYRGILVGEALEPVEVTWTAAAGAPVSDLVFAPAAPARIDVQLTDDGGAAIPGRISAQVGPGADIHAKLVAVVPTLDGAATIYLPEGTYTITGSRGGRWGICQGDVTLATGETATFTCGIELEVPTPGWISGDLHVHSEFSVDSTFLREERVKALIAEDIRFFAGTDHDVFADFRPIVEDMGVGDLLTASLGNESSSLAAHFNCLGCKSVTGDYFEAPWMELTEDGEVVRQLEAPEIWAILRDDFAATMVQINHPRTGQGVFTAVGYDPVAGPEALDPAVFDLTFDSIEVWNGSEDWGHLRDKTLPDWYSFLNRGHRKIAVGNSDSHELRQWVGQPHNLVQAAEPTDETFYAALKAGHAQATSAPFIEFSAGDTGLGDTVIPAAPDDPITLSIRVSAPTWVPLDTVRLVGNGAVIQEWDVSGAEGVLRLETELQVSPPMDIWYHVIAYTESADLAPVYPGRDSMAFTNPIWVDLDGGGFDPPLR